MSQATEGQSVMVQGRIVWVSGDLFQGKKKTDQNTRQPIIDQKTGLQVTEYGFGLAVPKSALQQVNPGEPGHIWTAIHQEATKLYPNGLPPGFAFKYKDGDGVDHNGQSFAGREGYAGCLIFAMTTTLPIKYFRQDAGNYVQISEGIKCGDYVAVQTHVKAHGPKGQGKPGLYLNPNAVLFVAYGKEIVNTPSGDQIFGNRQFQIPEGGSATPLQVATPGFMQTSAPAMPGMAPQGYAAPTPQPAQPHYGVLPPAHQPAAPAMPGMAPQGYAAPTPQPAAPGLFQQPSGFAGMPPMPGMPR